MTNASYELGYEFLDRELDSHFIVQVQGIQLRNLVLRSDHTHQFTVKYQTDHQASVTGNAFIVAEQDPESPKALRLAGYDADYLLFYITRTERPYVVNINRLATLASDPSRTRTKATEAPFHARYPNSASRTRTRSCGIDRHARNSN